MPKFIVACDFLIFADICGLFANAVMGNLHTEERASRTNFDWLFCSLNVNQSKKWAADVP